MNLRQAAKAVAIFCATFATFGLVLLFTMQRSIFYPAPRDYPTTAPEGFAMVETRTSDGLRLTAAYRPARPGKPTLVFFHGNGDSLAGAAVATQALVAIGYGAMLVEYRGYAGNPGSPSEEGLYRDGEAALAWLDERGLRTESLILIGNSMGSGTATELASRHPVRALILVSGFSSLPDVVTDHYPFLPARWLVRDRYESARKLGRIAAPILLIHGDRDTVVPVENTLRLARANPSATKIIVGGAGHELAYRPVAQQQIATWIETLPRTFSA